MAKEVKKFWETCTPAYAHLSASIPESEFANYQMATRNIRDFLHGKKVLDYGCGGGYFGKYLFTSCGISEYTGYDIAARSIEQAKVTLSQFSERIKFHEDSQDFKKDADVLFSIACIQHFPSKEYFDTFIKNVNESDIGTLVLQIREGLINKFGAKSYDTDSYGDVSRSTILNPHYVTESLDNYEFQYSESANNESNYLYMGFKLK